MNGKVFLIVGGKGSGKSTLRKKMVNHRFFRMNGILIQDLTPDGEGSWINNKPKKEVRELRERLDTKDGGYTPDYYKRVPEIMNTAKKNLRLFIGDLGGLPKPDEFGISDKAEFIANADGLIHIYKDGDDWGPHLPKDKPIFKFEMPTEIVENYNELLDIVCEKLVSKFENYKLESEVNYNINIQNIVKESEYKYIDVSDYYEHTFNPDKLSKIKPLPKINQKYCLIGKGPNYLFAKLTQDLDEFILFDPKIENPFIELPIKNRITSDNMEICYKKNQIKLHPIKEIFYDLADIPLITLFNFSNEKVYLNCKGALWAQLDLFLQLKDKVRLRGLLNMGDKNIHWIESSEMEEFKD